MYIGFSQDIEISHNLDVFDFAPINFIFVIMGTSLILQIISGDVFCEQIEEMLDNKLVKHFIFFHAEDYDWFPMYIVISAFMGAIDLIVAWHYLAREIINFLIAKYLKQHERGELNHKIACLRVSEREEISAR